MPLEIQRGRSKWFYARFQIKGKGICIKLNVEIRGKPPLSLRDEGDTEFERSRAKAQVAMEALIAELRGRANQEEIYQKILELKTGSRMATLPLTELATRWRELPTRRKLADRYINQCESDIKRFVTFLANQHRAADAMSDVTDAMARGFLKAEEARGVSPKRYNDILKFLRSCFSKLKKEAGIASNPFEGIPTKEVITVHRKPFSQEDLDAILEASKSDPFIQPLIILGITTAMRLGDCAMLAWENVNLARDFIDVKTSKTGALATIPIFSRLKALLLGQSQQPSGFVFPKLARQYKIAPDVLTNRVRKIMRSAGFGDAQKAAERGLEARGAFNETRKQGMRRASIRDFHSFRVTWVTLALNANLPMDLVRKVTGHRTAELVLKHYHQPTRDDFRRALSESLPEALTGEAPREKLSFDLIAKKLETMTEANWEATRTELLKHLAAG